jgi:16S rRNA (guanine(1405)-N(7))-methyltransferase
MENENILETGLAQQVISSIVDNALKKYKIDPDRAEQIVIDTVEKHPKFLRLLAGETETALKNILRTRFYREVNQKTRKQIYYELRQYNKNLECQEELVESLKQAVSRPGETGNRYREIIRQLAQTHISTKERLSSLDYFYSKLFEYIGASPTIVDVGCGLHPLLFPFNEKGKNTRCYLALDKDKTCISALSLVARLPGNNALNPLNWHIKDEWETIINRIDGPQFHTAFLMKLIPVVFRTEQKSMDILLRTPAKTWVITGSKTSMTKHFNIENRERKIIRRFIDESGKTITGEFSTEDEFCIICRGE